MRMLWQQIPSPIITEILCRNNKFDGVVLDNEHGAYSPETIFNCVQIATLCRKKCFVRLAEIDKTQVRQILDAGVDGLVFSTIEKTKQIKKILDQCFFPMQGGERGYGLTRDSFWGEIKRKRPPVIVAQIETVKGVDLIKERGFGVNLFDYYLIGPYDLSSSLGDPENFESKAFQKCIRSIQEVVGVEKMGYHIVKDISKNHAMLNKCGFLAYSLDTLMVIDSVKKIGDIVYG